MITNKDDEEEVWVEDFEEPYRVGTLEEFETHFKTLLGSDGGMARYVYVWTVIPLIPNAPY